MGRFIEITIEAGQLAAGQAERVVSACPVDIFALDPAGALVSVAKQEDECILCGRCVELAPGAVAVRRSYGSRRAVGATSAADDG